MPADGLSDPSQDHPAVASVVSTVGRSGPSADRDIEMAGQHHILISVKYEPCARGVQRSLVWLAPELVGTGLTLAERHDVRRWTGVPDAESYARFAAAWGLDEHPSHRYTFDGGKWEAGGYSPIIWVSLDLTELGAVERYAA